MFLHIIFPKYHRIIPAPLVIKVLIRHHTNEYSFYLSTAHGILSVMEVQVIVTDILSAKPNR